MQDTGPVLQRLQMEAYRAVLRAMAVAPMQYVSSGSMKQCELHLYLCCGARYASGTSGMHKRVCVAPRPVIKKKNNCKM